MDEKQYQEAATRFKDLSPFRDSAAWYQAVNRFSHSICINTFPSLQLIRHSCSQFSKSSFQVV